MCITKAGISELRISPMLGRKKGPFTQTEKQVLKEKFKTNEYLTKEERHQLSVSLNTTEKRIEGWFCRMRMKKAAEGTLSACE